MAPQTLKKSIILLVKVYSLPVVLLGFLVLLRMVTGESLSYFTKDPSETVEHPMYLGLYSNINFLFWGATAVVLIYTGILLPAGTMKKFIIASAALTTLLYLDDMFEFHERVFPLYLHFPQKLVFALYGVWILWYFYRWRNVILETDYALLVSAVALFGMSVAVDIYEPYSNLPAHHMFEDGPKLMGIVGWTFYFIRISHAQLTAQLSTRSAAERR